VRIMQVRTCVVDHSIKELQFCKGNSFTVVIDAPGEADFLKFLYYLGVSLLL
jgi:hypothetical protein